MKRLSLVAGIAVLAAVWLGPLISEWRSSFAAGMMAHMAVVAVAAPLIAVGLPDRWRPSPGMPASVPLLASLVELLAVWGWHAPAAQTLAEASTIGTFAEQATFLSAGVLLWSTSFASPEDRARAAIGAGALLLTSIHMTLLGALLALSPRALYGAGSVTCFGTVLDWSQDQHLGGVVMLLVGAVVYLAGGASMVATMLSGENRASQSSHKLKRTASTG